jgi:hypothetical protein
VTSKVELESQEDGLALRILLFRRDKGLIRSVLCSRKECLEVLRDRHHRSWEHSFSHSLGYPLDPWIIFEDSGRSRVSL